MPTTNLPVTPQGLQDELANTNRLCAATWSNLKLTARKYREECRHERNSVLASDRRYHRNRRHNLSAEFDYFAEILKINRGRRKEIYAAWHEWMRECAA